MAVMHVYKWLPHDTIWLVAGRTLRNSGATSTASLVDAIKNANPNIIDWKNVPIGQLIMIPFSS